MITEDYVSFETAKLLKEKGLEGYKHSAMYDKNGILVPFSFKRVTNSEKREFVCDAPTLQMAMKWLREEHKLHFTINPFCGQNGKICYNILVTNEEFNVILYNNIDKEESYEEACEAAIKYCLEILI